jgi:hypothetical protein
MRAAWGHRQDTAEARYYMQTAMVPHLEVAPPCPGFAPPSMLAPTVVAPAGLPSVPAAPLLPPQGQSHSVECWSVERVVEWLSASGLGHLSQRFQEHRITGDILLELSQSDLEEIGIHALGDKKRFLRAASYLRGPPQPAFQTSTPPPPPPTYPQTFNGLGACPTYLGHESFNSPLPSPVPNPPTW